MAINKSGESELSESVETCLRHPFGAGVSTYQAACGIFELWRNIGLEIFDKLKIIRNGKTQNIFWQRRYYDHNCRTREITIEKIEYCHRNPVVNGLVECQSEWCWSSYNWYNGNKDVILEMDKLE